MLDLNDCLTLCDSSEAETKKQKTENVVSKTPTARQRAGLKVSKRKCLGETVVAAR